MNTSLIQAPLERGAQLDRPGLIRSFYTTAARLDRFGFLLLRLGLVIVLWWVGGLKAANYEAEGIVPFVANSPLMSFFYHYPAPDYREPNRHADRMLTIMNETRLMEPMLSLMDWVA